MHQFPSDQPLPHVHHLSAQTFDQHGHVRFRTDESGGTYAELMMSEFVREMTEKVMSMEESVLAGVVADELRRRGYTVIAPDDPPEPSNEEGNRCALCGVPVRYGTRCPAHYGVYPKPTDSEADRG